MTVDRPFEGNQITQMPGTCEACVWGRGEHSDACKAALEASLRHKPLDRASTFALYGRNELGLRLPNKVKFRLKR